MSHVRCIMAMSTTSLHVTPLGSGMSQFLGVFAGGFTIEQPTNSPFNDLQIQPNPMRISISQPIQNTKIQKKKKDKKSHLKYVLAVLCCIGFAISGNRRKIFGSLRMKGQQISELLLVLHTAGISQPQLSQKSPG